MSHFLTFVFVSPGEANIEQRVNQLVDPYFDNEEREQTEDEQIKCDGFVIGGRYDQEISGVEPTHNLTPPEFEKRYGLDVISIEDNVRPARSVPRKLIPYAIVTPKGEWFECNDYEDWRAKVEQLLQEHHEYLVVAVDCHC
ncbi:MAG: hypothetical protein ACR2H6_06260 [Pyrinomonadaceae bacterium]